MRAVIVTTDTDTLAGVRLTWEASGVRTDVLTPTDDACRALDGHAPDLVVLDGALPRTTVERVYGTLRGRGTERTTPILFSRAPLAPATSSGADYVLPRDAPSDEIAALGCRVLGLGGPAATNGPAADGHVLAAPPNGHGPAADGHALAAPPVGHGPAQNGHGPADRSPVLPPDVPPRRAREARDRVRAVRGPARRAATAAGGRAAPDRPAGTAGAARRAGRTSDLTLGRFLLRWSWVLVVTTVLGVLGGLAFLQVGPVQYQSSALLTIRPQLDAAGEPLVSTNPARYQAAAQALAGQAASPSVYEATSRVLAPTLPVSTEEIAALVQAGRIQVSTVGGSSYISVTVTDRDPQRAWLLADSYARGLLEDLTAQTRVVGERRRAELTTEIEVLQQQLAAVPLNFNNPGPAQTFSSVHANLLESLVQAQVRLRMLAQVEAPLMRYGETAAPVQATSPARVLAAGGAVGLTAGLGLAYVFELLRQLARRRQPRPAPAPSRPTPSAAHASVAQTPVAHAAVAQTAAPGGRGRGEARPWAESTSH